MIEQHYPAFTAHLAEQGTVLSEYVQREFDDYLKCGRLEQGFQRGRCDTCHAEHLVALMAHSPVRHTSGSRRLCKSALLPICQRFGSALNLNIHFHMLFLDGVYIGCANGSSARCRWVKAPIRDELTQLAPTIAVRIACFLEREGLLDRDAENSDLVSDAVDEDPMDPLLAHSITYRITVGPQAGRKVFTQHKIAGSNFGRWSEATAAPCLRGEAQGCAEQTLPARDADDTFSGTVGKVDGLSLHAGVAAKAHERKKLERLCRYISLPAVCDKRLSRTEGGKIRYQLKTPYRDGTTLAQRRAAMTWAQRLKRVFNKRLETCRECGETVKVIACIEDPVVIEKILSHLAEKVVFEETGLLPEGRAPPHVGLFD